MLGWVIRFQLIYVAAAKHLLQPTSRATYSGAGSKTSQGRVFRVWSGASPPLTGESLPRTFQVSGRCMMIEQESDETDNSTTATTALQAGHQMAAAISAMLVRPLPGRPLALPLGDRVCAVRVPALGAATLVASGGLPAAPRGLKARRRRRAHSRGATRFGPRPPRPGSAAAPPRRGVSAYDCAAVMV